MSGPLGRPFALLGYCRQGWLCFLRRYGYGVAVLGRDRVLSACGPNVRLGIPPFRRAWHPQASHLNVQSPPCDSRRLEQTGRAVTHPNFRVRAMRRGFWLCFPCGHHGHGCTNMHEQSATTTKNPRRNCSIMTLLTDNRSAKIPRKTK